MDSPHIVGVGMSSFGRQPAVTLKQLAATAARAAMDDAGIGSAPLINVENACACGPWRCVGR